MRKKIAYAVFTTTDSSKEYMVKGNFGDDEHAANQWLIDNGTVIVDNHVELNPKYPNGLFVAEIKY